jgi:hypothetical protein
MPVPGPRTQTGPDPGYNNPGLEAPDRINFWNRPGPCWWPGRSPGTMVITLRGCILGVGQIRRLWRQSVDLIPAQASFSWSTNSPAPGRPVLTPGPLDITRALRYMTRSVYDWGGTDNTRFAGMHTPVGKRNAYKTVTINVGQRQGTPTVRNRLTSFGSRVPTLNQQIEAAQHQTP